MSVVADFLRTLWKMFAADLPMTVLALVVIGAVALGLSSGALSPAAAPFILTGGLLAALIVAIARGARRRG